MSVFWMIVFGWLAPWVIVGAGMVVGECVAPPRPVARLWSAIKGSSRKVIGQ